ncbi:MAG: MFS transporter [Candidatus Pristimantibacillus lignocellulolyticus]|uniref:MFS transporter n=1 Tax=Candidatus Pristimantibacillus lignocellulolyticus TaxID=2994561 RepID=A0A9J6ZL42_9BACL|nr:MAG: MFS transporter [Candidatus Pristimantibacillus lignocellulolyticus]
MNEKQTTLNNGAMASEKPRLWTKQFITLSLASFLLFLNLQMLLSSFSMHIKGNLNGGDMQVSLATSAFAITAIIARLLTGRWIKRWSKDIVLTVGLMVAAISTVLSALPESVAPLLVMRAIYGFGFGVGSTIIPTLVTQIIPPKRMGEGIGYFGLSTSLAMSIGPATGMSIMKASGFTTLATIGAGAVVCMIPMLFIAGVYNLRSNKINTLTELAEGQNNNRFEKVPLNKVSSQQVVHTHAQQQEKKSSLRDIMIFPIYFPAILNVLLSITYSGILSFIAVYGEQLNLSQVGLFFLFNALTILMVRPIAGKIFDRKGPIIVLIPAAIFVIVSMIVLSYTTSMGLLIVSALLYGVGFGSIQPTLQAWMLRSTSKEDYGTVNGLFYNATDLGVSLGAIILGIIVTFTSYEMMYRLSSICMILFVIGVIIYAKKRKKS